MPMWHLQRIYHRLLGWNDYPIGLILRKIAVNLTRSWCLWQCYRRVKHEGYSNPYILSQRQNQAIQVESKTSELVIKYSVFLDSSVRTRNNCSKAHR